MGSKAEREQYRSDSVTKNETNSSKIAEALENISLIKDLLDLVIAQVRVVSGDGTEQDLVAAKQRKLGLDGRLEAARAKFQKDIGLTRVETKETNETVEQAVDTNQFSRV